MSPHVLGSGVQWLQLYPALQGHYCDSENCDACAGSGMWQSDKELLIIDIHGIVLQVQSTI